MTIDIIEKTSFCPAISWDWGQGLGVGRIPHFPYPLLDSPLPASQPFPPTFFSRPRGRFVIGQSCINSLLSKGKKRGQRVGKKGKMRPCAIFCEERGAGLQRQGVPGNKSGREGGISDAVALSSHPPPPLPHLFTVLYYPRSPDFVLWHAQFNNTSHNTLLTHGKIVAAGTKTSKITR